MAGYGSAAGFKTYHDERGRDVPPHWHDADITAALLVASEWLDGAYASLWSGAPTGGYTQERQWPRTGATTNTTPAYEFTNSEIPQSVVNATYEAAYRELSTPGSLSVDFTQSKFNQVRVDGAIQVEYRNDFVSSSEVQLQITSIQNMMSPLVTNTSSSFLSGASTRVV